MQSSTFAQDGKRAIHCAACQRFLTTSHIGEKNVRNIKCRVCSTVSVVYPPRRTMDGEMKIIRFGPNEGLSTADLTTDEVEVH